MSAKRDIFDSCDVASRAIMHDLQYLPPPSHNYSYKKGARPMCKVINCTAAIVMSLIPLVGSAELVDTHGNTATNEMLLGVIDMGKGTVGNLMDYIVEKGELANTNAVADALSAAKSYTDSKEFTREVVKSAEYYVVTNPPIDVTDATITNSFEEAFHGMAFDLYMSNSVYFVVDPVPTLKFFAPKRRRAYFGNRISCVEIGDEMQLLKTYNEEVDGILAVEDPSRIRFMSTLDRNSPYDQGQSLTLQDYLDAFNPVLVPQMLQLYQTNHADFAVGSISATGFFSVMGESTRTIHYPPIVNENVENGQIHPLVTQVAPRTIISSNELFRVDNSGVRFMDSVRIEPYRDEYVSIETNAAGQVTNWDDYFASNATVTVTGVVELAGNSSTRSLQVKDKLYVHGFDDVVANAWGLGIDENGKRVMYKGNDDLANGWQNFSGIKVTLEDYIQFLTEPFQQATNEFYRGNVTVRTDSLRWYLTERTGSTVTLEGVVSTIENRHIYYWNSTIMDQKYKRSGNYLSVTKVVPLLPNPGGLTVNDRFLDVEFIFDLSGVSHDLIVDLGTLNFDGSTNAWETIISDTEPDIQTEQVLRTEESTWYDWIYDDNLGEWVEDTANPHTEVTEYYDEYEMDMTFTVSAYSVKRFKFKQVGPRTMTMDVSTMYKTSPQIQQVD